MGTIKYSKLVRDYIPEIIEASGKTCVTEILSDEDYLRMIDSKLDEELAEYHICNRQEFHLPIQVRKRILHFRGFC